DVSVETEAERDGPEQNGYELETSGAEEHDNQKHSQRARARPFGREQLLQKPERTDLLKTPDDPAREEDERHGERQVHIGVGAAEERLLETESLSRLLAPANRTDSRNQADPVRGEDEDEDAAEKPERPSDQTRTK